MNPIRQIRGARSGFLQLEVKKSCLSCQSWREEYDMVVRRGSLGAGFVESVGTGQGGRANFFARSFPSVTSPAQSSTVQHRDAWQNEGSFLGGMGIVMRLPCS